MTEEAPHSKRPRFGTDEKVFPKSEAMRLMSTASHVAFKLAEEEATGCGAGTVQPAHVFVALAKLCDLDLEADFKRRGFQVPVGPAKDEVARVREALKAVKLDPMAFRRKLRAIVGYTEDFSPALSIDQSCPQLLAAAERRRKAAGTQKIQPIHLLAGLAEQTFAPWMSLLNELDVKREDLSSRADALCGAGGVGASAAGAPAPARLPEAEAALAMDVCGAADLAGAQGDRMLARLRKPLQELVEDAASKFAAKSVRATGEGFLMTFASCDEAVRAALLILETARSLKGAHPDLAEAGLRFGLDYGQVFGGAGGERTGATVDLASRVVSTSAEKMHETQSGVYRKQGFPAKDRILLTHNAFKKLGGKGPFECLKAGYFDYEGFEGVRVAVYVVYLPA